MSKLLFINPSTRGSAYSTKLLYILRLFDINLKNVINRETRTHYISPKHILIKLINKIELKESPLDTLLEVKQNEEYFARTLKITHSDNKGKLSHGNFYNCAEILLLDKNNSLVVTNQYNRSNWFEIKPVTVIKAPIDVNPFNIPITNNSTLLSYDYAVLSINIPLLALKYHYWYLSQQERVDEEKGSIRDFISEYIVPDILSDQWISIAIARVTDRIKEGRVKGEIIGAQEYTGSAFLTQFDIDKLVSGYETFILDELSKSVTYDRILNMIPISKTKKLSDTFIDLKDITTYNNTWGMLFKDLHWADFAITVAANSGVSMSRYRAGLLRYFKSIESANAIDNIDDPALEVKLKEVISNLKEKIK